MSRMRPVGQMLRTPVLSIKNKPIDLNSNGNVTCSRLGESVHEFNSKIFN